MPSTKDMLCTHRILVSPSGRVTHWMDDVIKPSKGRARIFRAFLGFVLFFCCHLGGLSKVYAQEFSTFSQNTASSKAPIAKHVYATPYQAVATQIGLHHESGGVSIVVDMSHAVQARVGTMLKPDRLFLDFEGLRFVAKDVRYNSRDERIKGMRFGALMQGQSRIILDLAEPLGVEDQRFLDLPGGGKRLIVRLGTVNAVRFTELSKARYLQTPSDPVITGTTTQQSSIKLVQASTLPTIVLDPGHGGIDSGAASPTGEQEKSIVLAFALALKQRLESQGKVQVVLTRSDDSFISLADRVRLARNAKAALFVSLHADALPDEGDVRGASVYVLSDKATDERSQRLADKENRSDLVAGIELKEDQDEVADILFDLARRESRAFSSQFARTLVATLPRATRMHKVPLRGAGFRVLKSGDVPSVLLELGYLTTSEDAKLMQSEEWRANTADAAAEAIEKFIAEKYGKNPPLNGKQ